MSSPVSVADFVAKVVALGIARIFVSSGFAARDELSLISIDSAM